MLIEGHDTICAVASPHGEGAVSLLRLSGTDSLQIAKRIAPFLPEKTESHRVYYGHLKSLDLQETLDEVLLTYFVKGRSFTAEDSIEISCHGSPAIVQRILKEVIRAGARLAQRGEFTYRAFMNGRIDLVQAESVLALVQSQSEQAARQSLRQLRGGLSADISEVQEELTWVLSRLEANIDFSAEDIEFAAEAEIKSKMINALRRVRELIATYQSGRILRSGLRVVLVGAPNVGKSSLLNQLSRQNRAIVSPLPGTTRDSIETEIEVAGHKVTLVDTAGIHLAEDQIEKLGIERSYAELKEADSVLFLYDCTAPETRELLANLQAGSKPVLVVGNKMDLMPVLVSADEEIFVSATTGAGVETIRDYFQSLLTKQTAEISSVLMSARQYEILIDVERFLFRSVEKQEADMSPEFVISEVQQALMKCMELLGQRFDDEVLDRVFRDFCLGK